MQPSSDCARSLEIGTAPHAQTEGCRLELSLVDLARECSSDNARGDCCRVLLCCVELLYLAVTEKGERLDGWCSQRYFRGGAERVPKGIVVSRLTGQFSLLTTTFPIESCFEAKPTTGRALLTQATAEWFD